MSQSALVRCLLTGAGVLLLAAGHQGQSTVPPRIVLQKVAASGIDRGVSPDLRRPPRTSESPRPSTAAVLTDRRGIAGGRWMPGRVIVKFRDSAPEADRLAAVTGASRSGSIGLRPDHSNFDLVRIDPGEDAEDVARTLGADAAVEYAQAAYRVHASFVPNDPLYHCATAQSQCQWNFPAIDMERAWDIQPGATSSIVVAVLDTGVAFQSGIVKFQAGSFVNNRTTYPALGPIDVPFAAAPQLGPSSRFVAPFDFIYNDNLPVDTDGHGTHVAGTIGQVTNDSVGTAGLAFNVRLMPVKVLDTAWDDIFGAPFATGDTVARGIRYAADNGANIINLSLGESGQAGSEPVIEDAMRYAVGKGCFIAVAGGNDFENGNPVEIIAEIASRVQGAVSVAATDRGHNRAYYSTTGNWIEVAAPGGSSRGFGVGGVVYQQTFDFQLVDTFDLPLSQYGPPRFDAFMYAGLAGTSMATPHVAGLAALLMQQGIRDPRAIEAAIEQFAVHRGAAGRNNEFGYGEVSARDTLRGLGLAK